jgi:ABC-type nitrate/sulfonate/bicarbonate transport system substrate-binding protein/NAD-dependent dihydropyrimidine dehydrogenase PreA subunit
MGREPMIEVISAERCVGCNVCVTVCPTDVFDPGPADGPPVIARQADCRTCFRCGAYCPVDALFVAPHACPLPVSSPLRDEGYLATSGLFGSYRDEIGQPETKEPTVHTRRPRRAGTILAMMVAAAGLVGCGSAGPSAGAVAGKQVGELRYQGAVGAVTLPELAADLGYLGKLKLRWIGNTISGPQDIQAATTGDVDFGGAFNGAIIKLTAANAPIKAVIGYYGVDDQSYNGFYVTDSSPIRSARDLIGKKVGMNTLGAHHEAVLKTYLTRGGLSNAEIKQVTEVVVPPVNTEQALRAGQLDVAVLGGPLRDKALARGGIRPLFTDYDLLGRFTAGSFVFRNDFIKHNPDTVRAFVTGVAQAIEWARTQPRDVVIAEYEKIIKARGRNEDDSQLRYWKSIGVAGKGGLIAEREFATWIDWLTQDGELKGRTVKRSELYTNQFNPYRTDGDGR